MFSRLKLPFLLPSLTVSPHLIAELLKDYLFLRSHTFETLLDLQIDPSTNRRPV